MRDFESKIIYYSDNIAQEICDMPNIDVSKIKQTIKTRIVFVVKELFTYQVDTLEAKRRFLVQQYTSVEVPNWRKLDIQKELAEITSKKKDANVLLTDIKRKDEYDLLKKFVKEKFGNEALQEYFELQKSL